MRRQAFVGFAVLGLSLVAPYAGAAVDAASVVAVPPARYAAPTIAPRAAPVERLLPADAPRRAIALPSASVAERSALKAANAARPARGAKPSARSGRGAPLAIGFGRGVPAGQGVLDGATLPWVALPDGGFAARVEVTSSGAAALRLALSTGETDPDVTVRFSASAAKAKVFGPYPGNALAEAAQRHGAFWSPVLEGDTATIEIYRPADVAAAVAAVPAAARVAPRRRRRGPAQPFRPRTSPTSARRSPARSTSPA